VSNSSDIAALLEGREVCVCAGSGGVGKTTSSAAIAMGMASRGLRVAVLTIDPAKRLANSLGLEELGNEARQVEEKRFTDAGLEMKGELWAMMLDPKRTFDDLIHKFASDEGARDQVLENRIYQQISNAVAGSQEYMAMEKLYELHDEGDYDLLVLDTPPTRNALDFLDAPERLSRFIDSRSLQFFMKPGRSGLKLFGRGGGMVFSVLKRVTGVDLLQDLSEFFNGFADMAEGFRQRSAGVTELLSDDRSLFLIVTSPQHDSIDEAIYFRRRLKERDMPFGGVVVNRMHEAPGGGRDNVEKALTPDLGEALAVRVANNLDDYRALAERDQENVERLEAELDSEPIILVPYLDDDVHDLVGLAQINEYLFE